MQHGLGFHEPQSGNKAKVIDSIKSGLDEYINKVANKTGTPVVSFTPWKSEILKALRTKLGKCNTYNINNTLGKEEVREYLSKLHDDFVFVPVDKASCNIAIICKKFYMDILTTEIKSSSTFQLTNMFEADIIKQVNDFHTKYNTSNDKECNRIPFLYWTAKFHKNPYGSRYITAGNKCATSKLSDMVSQCLAFLFKYARSSDLYKFRGALNINNIAIVDNRTPVIKSMDNLNKGQSYDFSTLYTSIPHDKLKDKMKIFVENIFNSQRKKKTFIVINGKWTHFAMKRMSSKLCCTCEELLQWIYYIIDNSFITFESKVYRQILGIPMGTNCAPYLANTFLHVYEYQYIYTLISSGKMGIAEKLSNLLRYQDDCIIFNDDGEFDKHFQSIYPPEMVLKNTNTSVSKCTFLDLTISIYRGQFHYISYDKRDSFDFDVVYFPHLNGNIPKLPSYGVYISQLVRFCEINDAGKYFINNVIAMNAKFCSQGFDASILKRKYENFCDKYIYKWAKLNYDIGSEDVLSMLFGNGSPV